MNLVMASCGHLIAKSVVELTNSRHYHYHYSNISKVSDNLCQDEQEYDKIFKILLAYFLSSCEIALSNNATLGNYYSFSQDMCMVAKAVWQKYLPENKEALDAQEMKEKAYLSPSQVRKGMADLFDTFDKAPYLPTKYKKGEGRKKGTVLTKRMKYKTFKKEKNRQKKYKKSYTKA